MTLLGWLVAASWFAATGFLAVHARAMWTARGRPLPLPSWAVLIMAVVIFLVLTLSLFRITFGVMLPDELREAAFLLILIGVWVKFLGILYVRYGPYEKNRASSSDERIGVQR